MMIDFKRRKGGLLLFAPLELKEAQGCPISPFFLI